MKIKYDKPIHCAWCRPAKYYAQASIKHGESSTICAWHRKLMFARIVSGQRKAGHKPQLGH